MNVVRKMLRRFIQYSLDSTSLANLLYAHIGIGIFPFGLEQICRFSALDAKRAPARSA